MVKIDFLNDFDKRMKFIARFSVLCSNSFDKKKWKDYGVENRDVQMNYLFTLLLCIMEYSLKEEDCTMDDMAAFLSDISFEYYHQNFSYEKSMDFARFIVEEILGNSGMTMYFQAFDYESKTYKKINIRYIDNKVVYQDGGVKRTSYYLTDEGYNMILATMEMENNLRLSIHEMLFKLHLEKADYHKAVDDIRNIFSQLKKQSQKIMEAMHLIKRNALSYTVEEYRQLVEDNISTIADTREKFRMHREFIEEKIEEFEEKEISAENFNEKEKENLENLRKIGGYLSKTLDEHQKILGQHFDLKKLYDYELENYSNMTLVQRFPFRKDVYDEVLKDVNLLKNMDRIFNPLLNVKSDKIFNPEKMFEYQKRIRREKEGEEDFELDFNSEEYQKEKEQKRQERLRKYERSIRIVLDKLLEYGELDLAKLSMECGMEEQQDLIPSVEIFREIMIEFLTAGTVSVEDLRKEQAGYLMEASDSFVLNEMLLTILEDKKYGTIGMIQVYPAKEEKAVYFKNLKDETGNFRNLKCSNIKFIYEKR